MSFHSRQRSRDANLFQFRNQVKDSIHKELRHRGEPLVAYPGAELWKAVGGSDGVAALIQDLYRRIEQDKVLREAFPHFNSGEATPFFMQWFGGSRGYSDDLAGGLLRRHQHRYISPKRPRRGCAACARRSLPEDSTRSRSCGRLRASPRP